MKQSSQALDELDGTNCRFVTDEEDRVGGTSSTPSPRSILTILDQLEWQKLAKGGDNSRKLEEAAYFQFARQAIRHLRLRFDGDSLDVGLVGSAGLQPLEKIVDCRYTKEPHYGRACGKCIICQRIWSQRTFGKLDNELPSEIPWLSVVLDLPRWSKEMPEISDLMYIPPALLEGGDAQKRFSTSKLVSGLRAEAVATIQDIFPDMVLGMVAFVHMEDRYLKFRPHVHVLLSSIGLSREYYPLRHVNGDFPELQQAWRGLLRDRNLQLKKLRLLLKERWAHRLSEYLTSQWEGARTAFLSGIETDNVAYDTLPELDMNNISKDVRDAVLADENVVYIAKVARHPQTKKYDPVTAKKATLRYNAKRTNKHNVYTLNTEECYALAMTKNSRGKLVSCDNLWTLYNRLIRQISVPRVNGYQRCGYLASRAGGLSPEQRKALLDRLSRGYR